MKNHQLHTRWLSLTCAVFTIISSVAEPYQNGQKIESFSAKDQHEIAYTFDAPSTKYLLISHDMGTGKQANAALTALGKDFLGAKKAVFMANIHGMPGIGRFFAMPKMRKYQHRIIIADDEKLIAKFPEQKDKVTVLTLNRGKVENIVYWSPASEKVETFLK